MMGKMFMANLYASLDSKKSRFSQISKIPGGVYSTTFDPELRIEVKKFPMIVGGGVYSTTFDPELRNARFTLISFIGFPAILSTVQPFEIFIFNRT